ncbi:MAG: hypothetical protein KIT25_06595 [Enhydrobacter sp.]|nr:MAG: hypothetical protein KIT25_06595 [Enhydrobacter sp.]
MTTTLLRFGPWLGLALAALTIWGLAGRLSAAHTKLAAVEAVVEQKERDAALSAALVARQAEAMRQLEANVTHQVQVIHALPRTNDCARSPAMRAASRGLRELLGAGGPSP